MTATIEQKAAAWDAVQNFHSNAKRRFDAGLDGGVLVVIGVFDGAVTVGVVCHDDDEGMTVKIPCVEFLDDPNAELVAAIDGSAERLGLSMCGADFVGPDCGDQVPS